VQIEEECWDKLLSEEQKRSDSHTVEFMRLALMRADAAARSTFYHNAMQDGWMNSDEVRARENLNPIEGGKGKQYYRPLNMVPVGQEKEEKQADFNKQVWLGFQKDGTVADVMANLTDIKALTAAVGLPTQEEYVEPWLPVVADPGPLVSGDTVKDGDGDVVGGDVLPPDPVKGADVQNDQLGGGLDPAADPKQRAKKQAGKNQRGQKQEPDDHEAAAHARMVTLQTATRQMLLDVVGRMVRRLATHAVRAAKSGDTLTAFLAGGIDEHREVVAKALGPSLTACAAAFGVRADAGLLADGLIADVRRRIAATDNTVSAVEGALTAKGEELAA
jgi:hypothetical protein